MAFACQNHKDRSLEVQGRWWFELKGIVESVPRLDFFVFLIESVKGWQYY